jgi:hypothetical protein
MIHTNHFQSKVLILFKNQSTFFSKATFTSSSTCIGDSFSSVSGFVFLFSGCGSGSSSFFKFKFSKIIQTSFAFFIKSSVNKSFVTGKL